MAINSTIILAFASAIHPAIEHGVEISVSAENIDQSAYTSIKNEMANVNNLPMVQKMAPTFGEKVKVNGIALSDQFDKDTFIQVADRDSTSIPSSVSGGYGDCYANCHGSRGWR